MSRRRVLIVDDDAPFLDLLQLCFAKANFDVILASNGADALKILLDSEPPDLVLSDFMMPEVNGIELVRHVKASAKLFDTLVVLMSSNVDTDFRKRALDLGASAYLLKTEGAQAVAEKAIRMVAGGAPEVSASTAQVQAMQQSLLTLIRIATQMDGLPAQARSALITAEKLAESLFAAAPES
jgi:two-component system response regulator MprA